MIQNQKSRSQTVPITELAKLSFASLGPAFRLLLHPTTLSQWRRVLKEGMDPLEHLLIQANNTAIINRMLDKGTKVVFVSSFPRSGNTWMRYLLSDILLQLHAVETATQLPVHPDDLIPEFRGNSLARRLVRYPHWFTDTPVVFIKTHSLPARVRQIVSVKGATQPRDFRALYLYRSPEDALVSFYHFCLTHPEWKSKTVYKIDEFCQRELSNWMESLSSYLRSSGNGFPTFFVSYELLFEKPANVLGDLLRWIGIEHDGQMVSRAISNMQFKNLQAMELEDIKARQPVDGHNPFFRRGQPGSGRAELQESTLLEIQERTASLMREASQRQIEQASQFSAPAPHSNGAPGPLQNGATHRNGEVLKPALSPRLQQT